MLFNSLEYLFFFTALFVVYYLLVPVKWRWVLLLCSSIYFYYSWNSLFLIIIALSIALDYYIGLWLSFEERTVRKKFYLWLSVVSNIGLLAVFKYLDFFISNLNVVIALFDPQLQLGRLDLPFPVGISFYTFQTLSYTIDVYKGYRNPERNAGKFALYVLFFPQLLAGPIERSRKLLPQLNLLHRFKYENVVYGLRMILWGLFKKIVIADRIDRYIDMAYGDPSHYHGLPLLAASCLFTIQIYCDFSGYTDMAIGSARILGIRLSKNFENRVYFATSKANFWKGWHITLTEWFRDYLFFTIVGRSRSKFKFYASLIFVFLITGIWHGAGWGFIMWGTLHGLWIAVERGSYGPRMALFDRIGLLKFPKLLEFLSIVIIFSSNSLFAVWFRAESFNEGLKILVHSFSWEATNWGYLVNQDMVILLASFILMDAINFKMGQRNIGSYLGDQKTIIRWIVYIVILEFIFMFGIFNQVDFYYFRF